MEPLRLDDETLADYLRGCGLLDQREHAAVEIAGDGNINWVRRVRVGARSFVVKQARPALERFPEYQAPTERIVCEALYYETIRALDDEHVCPAVLHFDETARVLVLEDLGRAERLDAALARGADARGVAARIARLLGRVHAATAGDSSLATRFANDGMRRLHGDHIFVLPFTENAFPLPSRVRARAESIWRDGRVAAIGATAYERYLDSCSGVLVHADVQAGNVLLADRGAVLLDAEIAHAGDGAFDLGTLFAHLRIWPVARGVAASAEPAVHAARAAYDAARPQTDQGFHERAERYAALEMLRRTLGAARVAAVIEEEPALRVVEFALARL